MPAGDGAASAGRRRRAVAPPRAVEGDEEGPPPLLFGLTESLRRATLANRDHVERRRGPAALPRAARGRAHDRPRRDPPVARSAPPGPPEPGPDELRTFLTMLGMIFGVGAVIAMLAVGAGSERELSRIQELGIRNIILDAESPQVAGGPIGCLFGPLAIAAIVRLTRWDAVAEPSYALVSLGISAAVGILSGIWPARRAARMDPIGSLRHG